MYAIIIPVVMGPALMVVAWLENRAYKTHGENAHPGEPDSKAEEGVATPEEVKPPFITQLRTTLQQLDAIGLILLGFGWSLLLIPFSLSSTAVGGYNNPSLIAMFVVGGILVLAYVAYEYFFAMFPTAPRRLLKNRTFVTAVIIDFLYLLAGYMQLTYVYSWVYIVTDVNDRNFVCEYNISSFVQKEKEKRGTSAEIDTTVRLQQYSYHDSLFMRCRRRSCSSHHPSI